MFDLTTLDYIYIGIVLASTVWATIRGGVYETVATLSWIIAAITARFVSPLLDGLFQSWFKLSESTIGTLVASYFIIFFVILVGFGFFNQKLRDRVQESMMKVTDHTLGVVFGIIRGVILMGLVYWGMIWYYSDSKLPEFITGARTRPVMQLTASKIQSWFLPGDNKLLERDVMGSAASIDIYNNLINPAVAPVKEVKKEEVKKQEPKPDAKKSVADTIKKAQTVDTKKPDAPKPDVKKPIDAPKPEPAPAPVKPVEPESETGYKSSERTALENQLLQIESAARAEEKSESKEPQLKL